jgi:hypothetical protein
MPASFTCSICGKEHPGLTTDWAYKLPDVVWAIPEGERKTAARFSDDLCQFGERLFIRCVLPVPLRETGGEFGWGACAEFERPVFARYLELYDKDGSAEPADSGTLANALPAYVNSLGADVLVQFRDASKRPTLHLREADDGLLAREQRSGIDDVRYHEVLESLSRG